MSGQNPTEETIPDALQHPEAAALSGSTPTARPLPGSVTAAAVILLIYGVLGSLATLLMLLTVVLFAQLPNMMPSDYFSRGYPGFNEESFGAMMTMGVVFMVAFAVVGALLAAAHVAAGIGVLKRRGWARILGLVVSGLAVVVLILWLAGSVISMSMPFPNSFGTVPGFDEQWYRSMQATMLGFGIGFTALIAAPYVFVIAVLIRRGDVFGRAPGAV